MSLTPAQLTTLKADILGNTDQAVINALANGDAGAIAAWYNLDASPDYWIFRNSVSSSEIMTAIDLQNVVDITATDSDRVMKLLNLRLTDGYSGEVASDRSAWDDVFSAASGDESQQAIAALWQRIATNTEKLFALSTGSGANAANADTTAFQGSLSSSDVSAALNS